MEDEVKKKSSWKTTACGVAVFVGALCTFLGVPLLDGDPETVVNVQGLIGAVTAFAGCLGFVFGRDADVSSKELGLE